MATATLLPLPRAVFYDASTGDALSGGFVHTYVPGGTTPKTTWQDAAETTPNSNPIVLDAAGSCSLYGSGNYQITVTDALGNAIPAYSGLATTALQSQVFATIGDLRTVNSAVLSPTSVTVEGYYTPGGAGGGIFVYVPTDTSSTDNGGTIIVDAFGNRWYRQLSDTTYPVQWFGAKGDGITDDSATIQTALNVCHASGGGIVYLTPTGAAYLINHGLSVQSGTLLKGAGSRNFPGPTATLAQWTAAATWIQSTDLAAPAVTLNQHGASIEGINFIYAQPIPSGSFTPTTFPFTVYVNGVGGGDLNTVNNIMVIAGTHGIFLNYTTGSGGGTGVVIRDCVLSVFNVGLRTFFVNDTIVIEGLHVRNQWYSSTASVVTYILSNLVGWDCHYCDNAIVNGCEFFQCNIGILLTDQTCLGNTHSLFNGQLTNLSFNLVNQAMVCAAPTTTAVAQISNVLAQSVNDGSSLLFGFGSDNVDFQIVNLRCPTAGGALMVVGAGTGARMLVDNVEVLGFSGTIPGQSCFRIAAGALFSLGANYLLKDAGAGNYIAGDGRVSSVNSGYWKVFSALTSVTGTGSNTDVSTSNSFDPVGEGALQASITGSIDITTSQTGGTVAFNLSNYTEIAVAGINASAVATVAFNSGWIDINAGPGGSLGFLKMNATTGVVAELSGVVVEWR